MHHRVYGNTQVAPQCYGVKGKTQIALRTQATVRMIQNRVFMAPLLRLARPWTLSTLIQRSEQAPIPASALVCSGYLLANDATAAQTP